MATNEGKQQCNMKNILIFSNFCIKKGQPIQLELG